MIKLSQSGRKIENLDFTEIEKRNQEICDKIDNKTGEGSDFLGWRDYESKLTKSDIEKLVNCAKRIRKDYQALAVVGIGGSYLGARAAIDAINGLFPKDDFKIVFLGNTLSSTYTAQALDYLKDKKFAINVISKSGTTVEPSIAFRLLKKMLVEKYGEEYLKDAIVATTDRKRGALKSEANQAGYETFIIPDDIGGRFSVITPVGLLPIACAGIDIEEFISGVVDGEKDYSVTDFRNNPAYMYAAKRYLLHKAGYPVEVFTTYEPQFASINEWLKQLFAESEGKDSKGLFPASVTLTTDLHSVGQFLQQGSPILFETILKTSDQIEDLTVSSDDKNLDSLNYLAGDKMSYINDKAYEGTLKAHTETGPVSANIIQIEKMTPYNLGNLFYFFMRACAYSAYLLGVNPFNQPGVEVYKKNMFTLLGKYDEK